jgi:hypothetical protein
MLLLYFSSPECAIEIPDLAAVFLQVLKSQYCDSAMEPVIFYEPGSLPKLVNIWPTFPTRVKAL